MPSFAPSSFPSAPSGGAALLSLLAARLTDLLAARLPDLLTARAGSTLAKRLLAGSIFTPSSSITG